MFKGPAEIVVTNKKCRCQVLLEWINEGDNGDYDEDNAEDQPLMRFTVFRLYLKGETIPAYEADYTEEVVMDKDEWHELADSSYCTQIDARAPRVKLRKVAKWLLEQVQDDVKAGYRTKKTCERISWVGVTRRGRLITV